MNTAIYKALEERISELEDKYARLKRTYDDLLYNLDDDNFADYIKREKENMKTEIEVSAEGIKTLVSEVYPDGTESESSIEQNAHAISSKVSHTDLENELENYSTITQTSDKISTVVSKTANYENAHRGANPPQNSSLLWFDTSEGNECYKYYNSVSGEWEKVKGGSIYSIFTQTTSGFEFRSNVKISGDLITTGKITTADFDGSGNDYIQMQREFITFKNDELAKMALGFVKNKDGIAIPGIVFGAGDGEGNDRGYIQKETGSLSIFYIGNLNLGEVSYIKLLKDKAQINGYDIFTKKDSISDSYISSATQWNKAVIGTLDNGSYKVNTNKIMDGAVTNNKIDSLSADKITTGVLDGDNINFYEKFALCDKKTNGVKWFQIYYDDSYGSGTNTKPAIIINAPLYKINNVDMHTNICFQIDTGGGVYIGYPVAENKIATMADLSNFSATAVFA